MEDVLKLYIRNEKNQPRGVVVAVKVGDQMCYGFSLLNTRLDKWDRVKGTAIAMARAAAASYKLPVVPEREKMVVDGFNKLQDRALKYFKDMPPENIRIDLTVDEEDEW